MKQLTFFNGEHILCPQCHEDALESFVAGELDEYIQYGIRCSRCSFTSPFFEDTEAEAKQTLIQKYFKCSICGFSSSILPIVVKINDKTIRICHDCIEHIIEATK